MAHISYGYADFPVFSLVNREILALREEAGSLQTASSATPLKIKGFRRFTLRHFWHSEAIVSHLCAPRQLHKFGRSRSFV